MSVGDHEADESASPPALLTTDQLARLLKRDPSTLRRWRTSQPVQGPPYIRLSARVVMYDLADVEAWLARHRTDPEVAA
jgi:hypothetical protein